MTSKALENQQPEVRTEPITFKMIPPFKDRAEDLAATVADENNRKKGSKDLALEERAWAAWDAAWDRARNADQKAGRTYERAKYAERAHAARVKVLALGYGVEGK